jgi:hypothetical protein
MLGNGNRELVSRSRGGLPFIPRYVIRCEIPNRMRTYAHGAARERCALSIVSRGALNRRETNHYAVRRAPLAKCG